MVEFREGTDDEQTHNKIIHDNKYHLSENLSNKIVIDVGAHIGSFAMACMQRNAKYIYAYEANTEHYKILSQNLKEINNIKIHNSAVWKSDRPYEHLHISTDKEETVKAVSLDRIINKAVDKFNKKVDILKMNCEGAEYPILYTSTTLYSVKNIACKYYNNPTPVILDEDNVLHYNWEDLLGFLKLSGFVVYHKKNEETSMFFATREIHKHPFDIDTNLFS